MNFKTTLQHAISAVVGAIAVSALAALGNFITDGNLVSALGGITMNDIKNDTDIREQIEGLVGDRGPQGPAGPRGEQGISGITALQGAVVAFDLNGNCPNGWVPFLEAEGRLIVGAGRHKTQDEHGNALPKLLFGDVGGERRHTLSLEEMPKHEHKLLWYKYSSLSGGVIAGELKTGAATLLDFSSRIHSDGEDAPHENMPPYKVLIYCERNI